MFCLLFACLLLVLAKLCVFACLWCVLCMLHHNKGEGGSLGWVGSRPHPDVRDHGPRLYLRVATGPADLRLSGRKACRTVDRPCTRRWHALEGDAAMPVCMWCELQVCVWGAGAGRGSGAHRVTRRYRAWPGGGGGGGGGHGVGPSTCVARGCCALRCFPSFWACWTGGRGGGG